MIKNKKYIPMELVLFVRRRGVGRISVKIHLPIFDPFLNHKYY